MSVHVVLGKHWAKSRTIWANAAAGLAAGTMLLAQQLPDFKEHIPPWAYLTSGALLAAVNIWLRFATAAPIRGSTIHDAGEDLGDPTKGTRR
jgi:hypothetical protein